MYLNQLSNVASTNALKQSPSAGQALQTPHVMNELSYPSSYKVKEGFAATVQEIFSKHGDIVADCMFKGTMRMDMLHSVCVIYRELKKTSYLDATIAKLKSMRTDVKDLMIVQVNVSWLAKRLDKIYGAKILEEYVYSRQDEWDESWKSVENIKKEILTFQQQYVKAKQELELRKSGTILQICLEAEERMFCFSWKSPSISTTNNCATKGFKVNQEYDSAAKIILSKQGDILSNCLLKSTLRWKLLESACSIYQKMDNMSLKGITLTELEAVRVDVLDLENAQVDVSWLLKGIDDMYINKKLVEALLVVHNWKKENLEMEIKTTENKLRDAFNNLELEHYRCALFDQCILEMRMKVAPFCDMLSLADGIC